MNQAKNLLHSIIRLAPAGAPSAEIAASCARLSGREWGQLLRLGVAHSLLPVLYDRLKPYEGPSLLQTILPSLHDRYDFVRAKDLFSRYRGSIAGLCHRDPNEGAQRRPGLSGRGAEKKTWLAEG